MKKLIILNSEIYCFDKQSMQKGGVLTYIKDVARLGLELGAETIMYQFEDKSADEREYNWDGVLIRDVYIKSSSRRSMRQAAFDKVYEKENCEGAIFVIASDQFDIKSKASNVIQIQHGIAYDIPAHWIKSKIFKGSYGKMINKLLRCIRNVKRLDNTPNTVCVDYNYYNWYRTIGTENESHRMHVIPNYTSECITKEELQEKNAKRGPVKKIVFARRMVEHRGSLIFAKVAKRLLDERKDVDITFSGDGPCLAKMHAMLDSYSNVHFTEYKSEDSVKFHSAYDICVVPTIYSEGTSLSLIEGMAAGCVPVATHVGGLTNILLDGYNGFFAHPDEESFYNAMVKTLNMCEDDFNDMATKAYETATKAFFIDRWKRDWTKVLNQIKKT